MMRMRMKKAAVPKAPMGMSGSAAKDVADSIDWEVRPGGMLVQRRDPAADQESAPCPKIKVRVTYGSSLHEVSVSMQATFGELKKLLAPETGLEPQDQKIIFRGKERDGKDFLDLAGVKDKSKIVLMEDPMSREKKYIEMRKNAKIERASRAIAEVSLEVDKLAAQANLISISCENLQLSSLEALIVKGKRVAENGLVELIEMFMRQLVKLDSIPADGDAKLQRRMQVRRVQKYVETLDVLKVRNATQNSSSQQPVVVTTKWETFES